MAGITEPIAAVGTLLGGIAAIAGLASGGVREPAPLPAPSAPAEMPVPDDAKAAKARQRTQLALRQRSGRASTILSDIGQEKLG